MYTTDWGLFTQYFQQQQKIAYTQFSPRIPYISPSPPVRNWKQLKILNVGESSSLLKNVMLKKNFFKAEHWKRERWGSMHGGLQLVPIQSEQGRKGWAGVRLTQKKTETRRG